MLAPAKVVLGPSDMTWLAFSAIKDGLEHDFRGTCVRWGIHPNVADVIASFTFPQIRQLAERSGISHLMRVAQGDDVVFWQDLRKALDNNDAAGMEFSILSALFVPPPVPAAA